MLRTLDNGIPSTSVETPEPLLRVEGLRKSFRVCDHPWQRIQYILPRSWAGKRGRFFEALAGVSFDLKRGETLAVIGRNGSGKSTLLQLVAGVQRPTGGSVQVQGRVMALLELGCGFHPEFSGRENVLMWGGVMGFSTNESLARLGSIADFAEIGDFINHPIKTYSSGMFLRLAFATMTSLDADLLLIDEALAVGDVFFRQKCYARLEELRKRGAGILLVSHALNEVEQYCDRVILLHKGKMLFEGAPPEAVKRYYLVEAEEHSQKCLSVPRKEVPFEGSVEPLATIGDWPVDSVGIDLTHLSPVTDGGAALRYANVCDRESRSARLFEQGETAAFFFEFEIQEDLDYLTCGIEIVNERGVLVHGKTSLEYGAHVPSQVRRGDRIRFRQEVSLEIAVGEYSFSVGLGSLCESDYRHRGFMPPAELYARLRRACVVPRLGQLVVGYRKEGVPTRLLHHGIANLPGGCCDISVCSRTAPLRSATDASSPPKKEKQG